MSGRIQLSRAKGWKLPEGAVSVARPGNWGNPFTMAGAIDNDFASNEDEARKVAVEFFRSWLLGEDPGENDQYKTGPRGRLYDRRWMRRHLPDLRGKTLACWCPLDGPCHADVLLEAVAFAGDIVASAVAWDTGTSQNRKD